MIQDFRFALRQLLKAPGFTTVAVLTLALAIGVNSAIFALINGVVLRSPIPRADFVGSTLQVNGQPYTFIGITPDRFSGASALVAPDIWVPLGMRTQLGSAFGDSETMHDLLNPKNYTFNLAARLRAGLTIDIAKSRLPVLAQRLNALQPGGAEGVRELQIQKPSRFSLSTQPEDDGPITLIATLLMAMAGAVLLIACLNLANMLLARATSRSKEIAVRLAVGASRWQIVRQLLCEGLLLALCGGAVGLVLSTWCNDLLLQQLQGLLASVKFSVIVKLRPDFVILSMTFLFCFVATMLFSLGPALKATKADLVNDLKEQVGEPARIGRFSRFFAPRHISVMAQIALSLMLLFAAGLFFRGALKAAGLNPGFIAAGDIITEFDFSLMKKTPADARRTIFAMVQRARELPGVAASAVGTMLPYSDFTNARRILRAKDAMPNDPKAPDPSANALFTATTPGYFDALGVKLLRGRDFTQEECENKDARRVAIIDEEMAKKLFPNEDAIGQHIRYTQPPKDGAPNDMEIVGLVSKHIHSVAGDTIIARLFVPLAQGYNGQIYMHMRLNTQDRHAVIAMMPTLRQTLREIDPDLPLLQMTPYVDLMEKSPNLWIVKLGAILFGAFGSIALLLAVVGVYGVKAYAVACRTREIGIRMALGAHRRDVFALIMRQGAMQTALAVGVGLLLSLAAGRVLAGILYEVSPTDPLALVSASLMLATAALLACFFPARRATRVNPMTALRTE
jgi:predicted permease